MSYAITVVDAVLERIRAADLVAADAVADHRGDTVLAGDLPAIDVVLDRDSALPMGDTAVSGVIRHSLELTVSVFVRAVDGPGAVRACDYLATQVHGAISAGGARLGGVVASIVLAAMTWEREPVDGSVVRVDLSYTVQWPGPTHDLSRAGY